MQDKVRVDVRPTSGITLSNQQTSGEYRERERVEEEVSVEKKKEKKGESEMKTDWQDATPAKRLGVLIGQSLVISKFDV